MSEPSPDKPERQLFQLSTAIALAAVIGLFMPAFYSVTSRWGKPPSTGLPGDEGTTFVCGCVGVLALIIWRLKSIPHLLVVWAGFSCVIGFLGLYVPFGDATVALGGGRPAEFMGFCGQGVPIPIVIWDRGKDYPNPLAIIINPIAIFVLGMVFIAMVKGFIWLTDVTLNRLRVKKP